MYSDKKVNVETSSSETRNNDDLRVIILDRIVEYINIGGDLEKLVTELEKSGLLK